MERCSNLHSTKAYLGDEDLTLMKIQAFETKLEVPSPWLEEEL